MVSLIMAYSFTEPDENDVDSDTSSVTSDEHKKHLPVMVPVADVLNHVSKNNAKLVFGESELRMVATRNIKQVCAMLFSQQLLGFSFYIVT